MAALDGDAQRAEGNSLRLFVSYFLPILDDYWTDT